MQLKQKTCAVCREGVVTDQVCKQWFAKSHAGDFSLDGGAPRSGRPVEVYSDPIETLIENNQCYTTQERAGILQNIQIN